MNRYSMSPPSLTTMGAHRCLFMIINVNVTTTTLIVTIIIIVVYI